MKSCGVIGGGISGLAICYYLSSLGKGIVNKIVLLESADHCGGWMRSRVDESGLLFERGPRSLRAAGTPGCNTIELAEELGLSESILPISKTHPSSQTRFIYSRDRLHKLPNSFKSIITTIPPFSKPLIWYGVKELFQPKLSSSSSQSSSSSSSSSSQSSHSSSSSSSSLSSPSVCDDDYSVDSFFRRRFGSEVADHLINPMCRGIFAGCSGELSIRSCFRPIFDHEAKFGSVVKGMLLSPKKRERMGSALARRFKERGWVVWSLKGGLQQLPDAIEQQLNQSEEGKVDIRKNSVCDSVKFNGGRVQMRSSERNPQSFHCDHVFSSLPSHEIAKLTAETHPQLSESLRKIHFVDVGVVNLTYPSNVQPPHVGFGHLVPSHEDPALLGVIYEGCTFPFHNGKDQKSRFTVMLGGYWFGEYIGNPSGNSNVVKNILERMSLIAMRKHLGIRENPEKVIVNVLQKCIPQYQVGHHRLLSEIGSYITKNNLSLSLVGASYEGVSVNDCIYNARLAVEKFLKNEI